MTLRPRGAAVLRCAAVQAEVRANATATPMIYLLVLMRNEFYEALKEFAHTTEPTRFVVSPFVTGSLSGYAPNAGGQAGTHEKGRDLRGGPRGG